MNFFRTRKYFGEHLKVVEKRKTAQCDNRIPSLVYLCVTYLSQPEHVTVEGIFRLSAEKSKVEHMKNIINTKSVFGCKKILIHAFDQDIHLCTSILKK